MEVYFNKQYLISNGQMDGQIVGHKAMNLLWYIILLPQICSIGNPGENA